MRVLHVIPGLTNERGGPSAVVDFLTRQLTRLGIETTVLTTNQGLRNGEHSTPLHPSVRRIDTSVVGPDRVAFAPSFRSLLRTELKKSDVVHIHSIFTHPIHVTLREAFAQRVPVVLRPCGLLHPYSLTRSRVAKSLYLSWNRKLIGSACTMWHYTSHRERDQSWKPRQSTGFVLPNGIDVNSLTIAPEDARQVIGENWPELVGRRFLLFLGRLHAKKRLDLLVDAFLQSRAADHRLVVAGPDECGLWKSVQKRIPDSERGRIIRIEMVSGERKKALLNGADFLALPSEHENFGIAALESLAVGTPVLLSPFVDLGESFSNPAVCETIPLDTCAWTERIIARFNRGSPSDQERQALRARIAGDFSWDSITRKLVDHYRQLLEAPSPAIEAAQFV